MIKIWLKHLIYEKCIDIFFNQLYVNFVFPKILDDFKLSRILRKTKINWTIDVQKELQTFHGPDLDAVIERQIINELLEEAFTDSCQVESEKVGYYI